MNIREFATLCGVSPAVASRILNYPLKESRAAAPTYVRVREKAAELGFRPNYAAKALHSRKSNCIGVVIGYPNPVNCISIINGITDCAYKHGIFVSVAHCNNNPRIEINVFKELLYRGVDAIIWHPTLRRVPFNTKPLEKQIQRVTQRIPVICINDNNIPGIFKFRTNAEEDAANAALRQLRLGCKKFALLNVAFSYLPPLSSQAAYKNALLEHGVAPENIVEIVLEDKTTQPDWSKMRDIDGVWMFYLYMLPPIISKLQQYCDLKRLHVDGQSFVEDYALTWWSTQSQPEYALETRFGSLQYHIIDGTAVARRAAEIAIQAMADPSLEPFVESVPWQLAPHAIDARTILFSSLAF